MAQYVTVVNNGVKTYTEDFKGRKISIPPKGSIKMERYEAVQFLGTVGTSSIEKGIEKNLEIIRGETPVAVKEEATKFISHVDGMEFDTQEELDAHLAAIDPEKSGAEPIEEDVEQETGRRRRMKG